MANGGNSGLAGILVIVFAGLALYYAFALTPYGEPTFCLRIALIGLFFLVSVVLLMISKGAVETWHLVAALFLFVVSAMGFACYFELTSQVSDDVGGTDSGSMQVSGTQLLPAGGRWASVGAPPQG